MAVSAAGSGRFGAGRPFGRDDRAEAQEDGLSPNGLPIW
jgi:hypothetical protein